MDAYDPGPLHGPADSGYVQSPYPNAVQPEQPPFTVIPAPPHLSNEIWQTSNYDATSRAPMGEFVQRPAGPCRLDTGELIDGEWPESRIWKQV